MGIRIERDADGHWPADLVEAVARDHAAHFGGGGWFGDDQDFDLHSPMAAIARRALDAAEAWSRQPRFVTVPYGIDGESEVQA